MKISYHIHIMEEWFRALGSSHSPHIADKYLELLEYEFAALREELRKEGLLK